MWEKEQLLLTGIFSFLGLKQGLNNSPILFSLFIEDLELSLQRDVGCGLSLSDLCLIVMLFADDMVVLGKTPHDLQSSLNYLYEYCKKWGLEVNTDKTKIVVFRNRGNLKQDEKWFYDKMLMETVDNFNYLGTIFNYTGSFSLNNQYVIGKALKAMDVLIKNIQQYDVTPSIALQLFDSFVSSSLNYSSPVWGFAKCKDIERVHLKFCKSILGVKQTTCTTTIYCELGRYPLYVKRYVQIIKYWLKIIRSSNIVLSSVYDSSVELHSNNKNSWAGRVHKLLDEYGFSDVWANPFSSNDKYFVQIFRQRVIDCFLQKLRSDLENNTLLCHLYLHLVSSFEMAPYLDLLYNRTFRTCLSKIRLSSHKLRIESGRYGPNRSPRNERLCQFCNEPEIEDEFHFILVCKVFQDLRVKFIKTFYRTRPSMLKFVNLLNTRNKSVLINLGKFIFHATKQRNNFLSSLT